MKKILSALSIITIILYFSSCEKDDICVEGDTPLLVIGFYDIELNEDDEEEFKSVNSLRIRSIDINSILDDSDAYSYSDRSSSGDSILIPMQITESSSSFEFIINSTDDETTEMETGNIDTLTFNYTAEEEYISRACGFIANFNALGSTLTTDDGNWIDSIAVIETDVKRTNLIHVKVFH